MLSAIMINVIVLNVANNPFMLSVVMLNVVMLSVVAPTTISCTLDRRYRPVSSLVNTISMRTVESLAASITQAVNI